MKNHDYGNGYLDPDYDCDCDYDCDYEHDYGNAYLDPDYDCDCDCDHYYDNATSIPMHKSTIVGSRDKLQRIGAEQLQ